MARLATLSLRRPIFVDVPDLALRVFRIFGGAMRQGSYHQCRIKNAKDERLDVEQLIKNFGLRPLVSICTGCPRCRVPWRLPEIIKRHHPQASHFGRPLGTYYHERFFASIRSLILVSEAISQKACLETPQAIKQKKGFEPIPTLLERRSRKHPRETL